VAARGHARIRLVQMDLHVRDGGQQLEHTLLIVEERDVVRSIGVICAHDLGVIFLQLLRIVELQLIIRLDDDRFLRIARQPVNARSATRVAVGASV
jgi:hypothetical protein